MVANSESFNSTGVSDLDYDDDDPTRVIDTEAQTPLMRSHHIARCSPIIPPRIDEGDIYMLTKQHLRFKAGIVPLSDDHVDLKAILSTPPLPPEPDTDRDPDTTPDRDTLVQSRPTPLMYKPASLAPVAISAFPEPLARPTARLHRGYAATVAALAVAAVAVLFVPSPRTSAAPKAQAAAAPVEIAANDSEQAVAAVDPLELALVEVVVPTSPTPKADTVAATVRAAAPPQPPESAPDVAAHVTGPAPVTAEASEPPAPPPAEVELPPFNRSAASSALQAAIGAAGSCREQGSPNFPFNISVTFAPTGVVTNATVNGPPYAGTPQGGCIAKAFRAARINPFSGPAVTVHKVFQLP